jgi:excinuclease UvrABC nuclease subunit
MERRLLRYCSPIPRSPGVYRIWDGDECLYIGLSGDLSGDVPLSRVAESLVIGETFLGMKEMSTIARRRIEERGFEVDWIVTEKRDEAVVLKRSETSRLQPSLNVMGK